MLELSTYFTDFLQSVVFESLNLVEFLLKSFIFKKCKHFFKLMEAVWNPSCTIKYTAFRLNYKDACEMRGRYVWDVCGLRVGCVQDAWDMHVICV